MSQNDFNIANQGFPATRADINSALQALASTSAGATAPSTTYAYQLWYDTSTNLLKMRNADNDGFITLAAFDQAADEWEVRTAVVQAVDSAGVVIKTDDGTTRVTIADSGNVTLANDLAVTGTVQSANITDGTTTVGTSYVVNGSARAWLQYLQATPVVSASFGVSSVTDNATGNFTVNYTNAFSTESHARSVMANAGSYCGVIARSTTNTQFETRNDAGTASDTGNYGAFHGNLA